MTAHVKQRLGRLLMGSGWWVLGRSPYAKPGTARLDEP